MGSSKLLFACALACAVVVPAHARTYCCNDAAGRRVCGDILPSQCFSRPYQEFGSTGILVREHAGALTPEQRAQKQAEEARKKEAKRLAEEQERRDRALLASYTTVADIDKKRDRTITDLEGQIRLYRERRDEALADHQKFQKQAQALGDKDMPEYLKKRLQISREEVATQQAAIDAAQKEIAAAKARFAEERQRFLELTRKATEGAADATPPASSSVTR